MTADDRLHIEARKYADFLKSPDANAPKDHRVDFDKKQLRWNGIVAVGIFYGRCGAKFNLDIAITGVREAVSFCDKNDPSGYIPGGSVLSAIQPWMISCEVTE